MSFIGGQPASDFLLNGIITSFFSGLDISRSKSGSFFLLQVFVCYFLKNFVDQCQLLTLKLNQCPGLWTVQSLHIPATF